ncbi:MAG: hypothetical protein CM15mP115_14210 [Alphaproteobacteria bacterium]|nr:MAG: hypothetical protein CM15mP115_14210 [Alphaproteobacteria bacterium]
MRKVLFALPPWLLWWCFRSFCRHFGVCKLSFNYVTTNWWALEQLKIVTSTLRLMLHLSSLPRQRHERYAFIGLDELAGQSADGDDAG